MNRPVLMRLVSVPISFKHLIKGQPAYMAAHGFDVHLVSANGPELNDVLIHEQLQHHEVPFTRSITPLHDIKCLFQLVRLFKKHKPAIVHTQTPKAGLLGQLAAWYCNIPVRMHTVGGLPLMETTGFKKMMLQWIERITYAGAHLVMPNSNHLAQYMHRTHLLKSSKTKVLGSGSSNGINTQFFSTDAIESTKNEIRGELGIAANAFVFLFVGRLVQDKGINELVSAFDSIYKNHTQAILLLVGPYEQELDPLLPQTVARIAQHPAIRHEGYQSDVRKYYKASDLLCFPSYREGFPNVPMQAGAMGLPMIVTDINGCNEIVEEGVNGWIIPVKDTEALRKRMERSITDHGSLNEISASARSAITSRFEQQHLWSLLLEQYRTQLARVSKFN